MKYILDRTVAIAVLLSAFALSVYTYLACEESGFKYAFVMLGLMVVHMTVTGAVYGIAAGIIPPILAGIFVGYLLGFQVRMTDLIILILFGGSVGYFANKFGVRDGQFDGKNVVGLNIIIVSVAVIIFILTRPFLRFFSGNINLYEEIQNGMTPFIMVVLLTLAVSTPIIIMINTWYTKRIARNGAEQS